MTDAPSSYLQYLPKVLWEDEPAPPQFSLGRMLRIFEKLLTGIADQVEVTHGDHMHASLAETIAHVYGIFDPWTTPPGFLEWLAAWVALPLAPNWSEYQRRQAVAQITSIYARRGRRDGLASFLDLYGTGARRLRVTIDDGSRVLFARVPQDRPVRLATLVGQGPALLPWPPHTSTNPLAPGTTPPLAYAGPIHPTAIALSPDGSLLLADAGTFQGVSPPMAPGVWRLSAAGAYAFAGTPFGPVAVKPSPVWTLRAPAALLVDAPQSPTSTTPWRLWVLDQVTSASDPMLYQLSVPSPGSTAFTVAATFPQSLIQAVYPVALVGGSGGRLLIIDRGYFPGTTFKPPKLLEIDPMAANPLVASRSLPNTIEPLAAVMLSTGALIVAEARGQSSVTPGDLSLVDPATGLGTSLLGSTNPLVCPRAILRESDTSLLVADAGRKPFRSSPGALMRIAEPPAIYRVDTGGSAPLVTTVSEDAGFVFPTGLARSGDVLYVADAGYSDRAEASESRVYPHRFSVAVHFTTLAPGLNERRRILLGMREIVDRERPAHTSWTMVT